MLKTSSPIKMNSETDCVEEIDGAMQTDNYEVGGDDAKNAKRMYACLLCSFDSEGPVPMLQHLRSHNRTSPWNCSLCSTTSSNVDKDPLEDGHGHSSNCLDRLEMNEDCDLTEESLGVKRDPDVRHKCTLCSFDSPRLSEVLTHIRIHLRKKESKNAEFFGENGNSDRWDNMFTCTECEFSCVRPDKLEKHMILHAPGTIFLCAICDFEASTRKEMQQHRRVSHEMLKPFACKLCNAKFTRSDNLKTHEKIHSGERPFTCKFCSYAAPNKARLICHYNCHKGGQTKPKRGSADCPVCGRSFTSFLCLTLHRKMHKLTAPFICRQCDTTLPSAVELYNHQTDHIEQSVFSCLYCEYKCFDEAGIHSHLGTAHGADKPFQCETCGYRFATIVHWKRHQLVHTGEKPFACELCPAQFSQAGNRKAHMIKIHSVTMVETKRRRRTLGNYRRIVEGDDIVY